MRAIITALLLTTAAAFADDAFWETAEANPKVKISKEVPAELQGKYALLKIYAKGKWVDATSGGRSAIFMDLEATKSTDGMKGVVKPVEKVAQVNFEDGTPMKTVIRLGEFTDITIKPQKEHEGLFLVLAEEQMPGQPKQSFNLLCFLNK